MLLFLSPEELPQTCRQSRTARTRIRIRFGEMLAAGIRELLGLTGLVAWLGMVWWALCVVR